MRHNEFVIRFGNVNGSGSASANLMFATAVFRSGLPISAKNIFPSNIQGAPTHYEVRASEAGHTGRKEEVDLVVGMNPQTYPEDLASVVGGGMFLYDNTLVRGFDRDDIDIYGVPFTRLCLDTFGDVKQRFMYRNLAINGTLCELLGMDEGIFRALIEEKFGANAKLVEVNIQALELGLEWVRREGRPKMPVGVRPTDAVGDAILVSGNEAAGLGCLYGGASVAAWYPITPSTSVAEGFEKYVNKFRRADPDGGSDGHRAAIIQAEDELSAIGVALGAGWNGARAFTATSGPGISLMSEFLGLGYFAEIPVVVINIQRGGPSTGMPTRTQQSDILSSAYASHGDTLHPMVFPATPAECFSMTAEAFDLADRLQTPVFVMSDLDLGMNDWVSEPFAWDDARQWDRGKVVTAEQLEEWADWGRYKDMDGDGIPWRSLPATHPTKGAYLTRGTSHDEYARYTEDGKVHKRVLDRIRHKWETAKDLMPKPEYSSQKPKHPAALLYFGSSAPAVLEAREMLRGQGVELDWVRLRGFPFDPGLIDWLRAHDTVLVMEQNRDGQMRKLLGAEGEVEPDRMRSVLCFDGMPPTAADLVQGVLQALEPPSQREAAAARKTA